MFWPSFNGALGNGNTQVPSPCCSLEDHRVALI
jgi:hypothetical protein